MTTTVLVVGATGMLGREVVAALAGPDRRAADVAVTVRAGVRPGKADAARDLRAAGAVPVALDLDDPATLAPACAGVDVVVSCVQGGRGVIVDGQTRLVEAAARAGVPRMIPSDFSVDQFRLDDGDNDNSDLRRAAHHAFDHSSVTPTSVLVGALIDVAASPWLRIVDWDAGTFSYWGDGEQPCDFTTIADTARYTAAAALDPDLTGTTLRVAGEVLSMLELHEALQAGSGHRLEARCLGTVDDLAARIQTLRQPGADQMTYLPLQYAWTMVSGKGKLDPLDNDRYPDITPTPVAAFVADHPQLLTTS